MEQVIIQLQRAVVFLNPYLGLVNSHMVEFFTKNLWDLYVPLEIKKELELANLSPSSIIKFFKKSRTSTDSRLANFLSECSHVYPNAHDNVIIDLDTFLKKMPEISFCESYLYTNNTFMSLKKEHEVILMSSVVHMLSSVSNSTHIVDVGDGRGYLSSHLAMQKGLKVLGVDGCETKTISAIKRVNKMQKHLISASKKPQIGMDQLDCDNNISNSDNGSLNSYKQITEFISPETDLSQLLNESFPGENSYKFGIVGLHTCGSLSPACLKLFVNNEHSNFLVNVGCCYHLLEETEESALNFTFPLSNFLIKKNFKLGRNARMLSLQAPDRLYNSEQIPDSLMYRAVFELFLAEKVGDCDRSEKQVGRLGSKCQTFEQYCRKGLMKLGLKINVSDSELKDFYEKYEHQKLWLNFFYMLRVSIAPVIEHIILLDRLLYLHENGLSNSYILRLFDSTASPRCFGIISMKNG